VQRLYVKYCIQRNCICGNLEDHGNAPRYSQRLCSATFRQQAVLNVRAPFDEVFARYNIPGATLAIHTKFHKNRPWDKGGVREQTNKRCSSMIQANKVGGIRFASTLALKSAMDTASDR
jgi:hypothetical protein